jgi:hypothetical protein
MERQRSWKNGIFRPDLLARGFFSQRAQLYPLDEYDLSLFLNDWKIEFQIGKLNDPSVQEFLSNKLLFHLILRERFPEGVTPGLIGIVADDTFVSFSRHGRLEDALADAGFLIAKPIAGAGGKSVCRIVSLPHGFGPGMFIVESGIRQHPYASSIHPHCVNTIRVLTLKDPDTGQHFVAGAAHRFGTQRTGCVDNFSRGGLSALVDIETGTLSAAKSNPGFYPCDRHPRHFDSGVAIGGVSVPYWEQAKDLCIKVATSIPGMVHVGWDVAITADGPVIVEGNARIANPNLIQAHRPLVTDPRIRRFYEFHGVLP